MICYLMIWRGLWYRVCNTRFSPARVNIICVIRCYCELYVAPRPDHHHLACNDRFAPWPLTSLLFRCRYQAMFFRRRQRIKDGFCYYCLVKVLWPGSHDTWPGQPQTISVFWFWKNGQLSWVNESWYIFFCDRKVRVMLNRCFWIPDEWLQCS